MSEGDTSNRPFDLEGLRELIEMMEAHGVTEVSLRHGEEQWRLRRGSVQVAAPAAPIPVAPAAPAAAVQAAPVATAEAPAEAEPAGRFILCPAVGTFYASPSPEDPPFVKVGDKVQSETVVCLVEAMKTFNQIPAELSGTIAEILVKNGDPVDVNTKLFRVE